MTVELQAFAEVCERHVAPVFMANGFFPLGRPAERHGTVEQVYYRHGTPPEHRGGLLAQTMRRTAVPSSSTEVSDKGAFLVMSLLESDDLPYGEAGVVSVLFSLRATESTEEEDAVGPAVPLVVRALYPSAIEPRSLEHLASKVIRLVADPKKPALLTYADWRGTTALQPHERLVDEGLGRKIEGNVKWFNDAKGFGFLSDPDGKEVFIHHSEIKAKVRTLIEGDRVTFEVIDSPKGPRAVNIEKHYSESPTEPQPRSGKSLGGRLTIRPRRDVSRKE
jgi:CspA family cold shock protein